MVLSNGGLSIGSESKLFLPRAWNFRLSRNSQFTVVGGRQNQGRKRPLVLKRWNLLWNILVDESFNTQWWRTNFSCREGRTKIKIFERSEVEKKKYLKKYRRLGWKRETKGCFLRHKKLLGILRDWNKIIIIKRQGKKLKVGARTCLEMSSRTEMNCHSGWGYAHWGGRKQEIEFLSQEQLRKDRWGNFSL